MRHQPIGRLPLQDLSLAPASLRAYTASLNSFLTHTRLTPLQFYIMRADRLDRLLALFIQWSHDTGQPFTYSSHALHAAIHQRPALRFKLPISRQCLKGWERTKKSSSRPPLSWELTITLACTIARSGHHAAAVAMLVAFDCYLRVGELTRLRRCDIIMPNDRRMGSVATGMAVCLERTKTGLNQSVTLQNPDVATILCIWMRSFPADADPTTLIFPFTPDKLRKLMHSASVAHGVGHIPYVPHSLRHGGATHDFARTNSVAHVQFRGRWKSLESVRRYVQMSKALLAAHDIPQPLHDLGLLLSGSVVAVMRGILDTVPAAVPRRVTFQRDQ